MNAFDALKQQQAGGAPAMPPPVPAPTTPGPMGAMPPPSPTSFAPPMDVIRRVAFENQVPAEDVYGIAKTESGFNPNARSPKGAVGPMQLLPGTAADMGVVDPNDPEQNYEGGARYYAQQLKAFGGDRAKALEAYNAGPGRVAKASKTGLPLPAETQAYVPKVEKARSEFTLPDSAIQQANEQMYAQEPQTPPPPVQLTDKAGTPKPPQNAFQALRDQQPPTPLGGFMDHPEQAITAGVDLVKHGAQWAKEHPREAGRIAVELAMMTGGAMLAPEVAVPLAASRFPAMVARVTNLLSKAGGAGLGGAVGSLASETFDPSGSPKRAVERAEQAGEAGAVGEGAGQAASRFATWLAAPYRSRLTPDALRTKDILDAQRKPGENRAIPPSVLVDSPGFNITEKSLGATIGGGVITKGREQAEQLAIRALREYPAQFGSQGGTQVERGQRIQQRYQQELEAFKQRMDAGYATVDRLNAQNPIMVDIEPIKLAAAQRWIQHSGGLVDPATTKLVNDLFRKPNLVSFRDAAQLRSDLMKLRDPEAVVQGQVPAMGESLSQAVDRQIDLAGNALNPQALAAYRLVNRMYRGDPARGIVGIQQFEDPAIARLMQGSPDAVAPGLFGKNRPVRMESLKQLLGRPADTTEFRRLFTEHLVTEAGAEPSGKTLANVLFKYGDTLEAVMGRQHANDLRAIATAMERAQGNTMGQQGQGLIRIGQGSVAMSMIYSNMQPGRAAAVMLIPGALSWMLMRPQVAHWLSIGYTLPPTAKEAIKVAARIKALAKADQMPIYEVPASWLEQGPPAGAPPLPVQPPRGAPAPPAIGTSVSGQPGR